MLTEPKDNIKEELLSVIKIQKPVQEFSGRRNEALSALSSLDIPTSKHEEWKYTDFSKVLKKNFNFSKVGYSSPNFSIDGFKIPGLDATYLVFLNGKFIKESSEITDQAKVLITDLKEAEDQNISAFTEHFGKHADFKKDFFTALSTAYYEDGLFIKIAEGAVIEKPIVFLFISDSRNGNSVAQPRNLVFFAKNSEATIIENFVSVGGDPQFTNTITEIVVSENAHGKYYKLQNEGAQSYHIGTTQVYQERNSNFTAFTVTTGGAVVRNNLNIKLDGENSNAYMNGLYVLNDSTHVDNHTAVDHAKPHAYSNELYKGIMNGKSTGVFNGKIFVRQDAQKTNAFQSNRNVLLSDEASIFTKPQLEIWADDVKCSHGATTGQIDEDALFYLQTRGISKDSAKALLMLAFASEIVEAIKIEEIKVYLEKIVHSALHTSI